jgi:hypothetical protein
MRVRKLVPIGIALVVPATLFQIDRIIGFLKFLWRRPRGGGLLLNTSDVGRDGVVATQSARDGAVHIRLRASIIHRQSCNCCDS